MEVNTLEQAAAAAADTHRQAALARLHYPDVFQELSQPNRRQLLGSEIMRVLELGRCAGLDDENILRDIYRINDRRSQYV
jgi:hypothetical protein